MEQKMEVIYEDEQLLICYKPAGLATQTSSIVQEDMVSQVKNYRKGKGEDPYVGVVHRLDQPVEGLLAFAKTPRAADLPGTAGGQKRAHCGGCQIRRHRHREASVPLRLPVDISASGHRGGSGICHSAQRRGFSGFHFSAASDPHETGYTSVNTGTNRAIVLYPWE